MVRLDQNLQLLRALPRGLAYDGTGGSPRPADSRGRCSFEGERSSWRHRTSWLGHVVNTKRSNYIQIMLFYRYRSDENVFFFSIGTRGAAGGLHAPCTGSAAHRDRVLVHDSDSSTLGLIAHISEGFTTVLFAIEVLIKNGQMARVHSGRRTSSAHGDSSSTSSAEKYGATRKNQRVNSEQDV